MEKQEIIKILRTENDDVSLEILSAYADNFIDYQEAVSNISEQGAIVAHPKNGAPIDNPYLKIRDSAQNNMRKCRLNTDSLWELMK